MEPTKRIDPELRKRLEALYREIMWLAKRPNVTPSMARAWYTHVVAGRFIRDIRVFSGKVSQKAAVDRTATLRLEHHSRIQTKLTGLVARHVERKRRDPQEFIHTVIACENVHIVTFDENYAARRNGGDYRRAGIKLVSWRSVPVARRHELWAKVLRGKVSNAADFDPRPQRG